MKKHPTKFTGYYATECGRVFRDPSKYDKTKELIEVFPFSRGGVNPVDRYMSINISIKDGNHKTIKQIRYYVHRLIAETFVKNPNQYKEVDHIDMNKKNNHKDNLRWVSRKDNWIPLKKDKNGKWLKIFPV